MLVLAIIFLLLIFLSSRDPVKGLGFYVAVKLCIPPSARLLNISFNTLALLTFALIASVSLWNSFTHKIKYQSDIISLLFLYTIWFAVVGLISYIIVGTVPLYFQYSNLLQLFVTDLLPAIFVILIIKSKKDFETFVSFLYYAVLFSLSYAVFTFVFQDNPLFHYFNVGNVEYDNFLESGRGEFQTKAVGVFNNQIMLSIVAFLITTFFFGKNNIIGKTKVYLVLSLSLLTVFLTLQRSAGASFAVFLALLLFGKRGKFVIIFKSLFYVFLGLFALQISGLWKIVSTQIFNVLSILDIGTNLTAQEYGGSSFDMRLYQLANVLDYVGEHYLYGMGISFPKWFSESSHHVMDSRFYGFESLILSAYISSGVLGIINWAVLFYKYLKLMVRESRFLNTSYYIAFILSFILVAVMTNLAGSFPFFLIFANLNIIYARLYYPYLKKTIASL